MVTKIIEMVVNLNFTVQFFKLNQFFFSEFGKNMFLFKAVPLIY